MIKLTVIGRPTLDVALQKSKDGKTEFISFPLAVNEGYGDFEYTEYPECYSSDAIAQRIVKAKVSPKSLIWIEGTLKTKEYERKKKDKTSLLDEFGNPVKGYKMQVRITDWGFVQTAKSDSGKANDSNSSENPPNSEQNSSSSSGSDDELPY